MTQIETYRCQNCQSIWTFEQLVLEIPRYWERVGEGEPEPAGECPECGSLCHEVE